MYDYDRNGRGCIMPLAQSLISAVFVATLAGAVALYAEWNRPGHVALLGGALAGAWWWLSSLAWWRRLAFPELQVQPVDDNQAVDPIDTPPVVVQLTSEDGRHVQLGYLEGVNNYQLAALAEGLLTGQTFSESTWTGAGRPFSKAQFHHVRREFMKRQWCAWRNPGAPAQGIQLTAAGRAVMRSFASDLPY